MGTNKNETEKGQEQPFSAETIPDQVPFPAAPTALHPKHRRWLVVIISTVGIVLLLAASVSAVVLIQAGRRSVTVTPTPNPTATAPTTATPTPPPRGQWVQVLSDYRVTSLAAAPSHPNVLYACGIPSGLPDNMAGVQTVLRSEDFGTHWQDIGSRAQMSRGCELTINPANSDEIYVATSSHAPTDQTVVSFVLKHTLDGGQTWETIHATVSEPGQNTALDWEGEQLRFAENRLYSMQSLPIPPIPTPQGPPLTALSRLLVSTDGGHTWNVLDTQMAATGQLAAAYAVSPTNPMVLYELAGLPTFPGGPMPQFQLYKSVDSGQTWQPLLQQTITQLSIGKIEILVGSEDPNLIYLTNTGCPTSQTSHTGGGPLIQQGGGTFTLCVSQDEGKSWRTLLSPDQLYSMSGRMIDRQGRLYAEGVLSGSVQDIWRYDPTSDTWSKVAQTPLEGYLPACTSTGSNDTTVLWFINATGQVVLYRYIL